MPPKPAVSVPAPEPPKKSYARVAIVAGVISLALIAAATFAMRAKPTALERFWDPVFSSSEPASIYIGGDIKGTKDAISVVELMHSEKVSKSRRDH